ncbi:MAG: YceI family protein [Sphingobacteriaceae bacterium]|nr:YceI family protein [Sphingobacteriaceae bacterium]
MISVKKLSKALLILSVLTALYLPSYGQNLTTKTAKVRFFSSTPIEDIKAASEKGVAVLLTKTGEIAFQVPIKSFEFSKGLMQEHFNENYMESDKYPYAKFNGKVNQPIDLSKDGEHNVTATGTLLIHGVAKQRTIPGKLKVANGKIQLSSSFDVACVDHKIKIPRLVMTKIAEVIKVSIDATLNP